VSYRTRSASRSRSWRSCRRRVGASRPQRPRPGAATAARATWTRRHRARPDGLRHQRGGRADGTGDRGCGAAAGRAGRGRRAHGRHRPAAPHPGADPRGGGPHPAGGRLQATSARMPGPETIQAATVADRLRAGPLASRTGDLDLYGAATQVMQAEQAAMLQRTAVASGSARTRPTRPRAVPPRVLDQRPPAARALMLTSPQPPAARRPAAVPRRAAPQRPRPAAAASGPRWSRACGTSTARSA
jgi:hypothetical protein